MENNRHFVFDLGWLFATMLAFASFIYALWARDWLIFGVTGFLNLFMLMLANQVRMDDIKHEYTLHVNVLKNKEIKYEKKYVSISGKPSKNDPEQG